MIRTEEGLTARFLCERIERMEGRLQDLVETLTRARKLIASLPEATSLRGVEQATRSPYAWAVHDAQKAITDTLFNMHIDALTIDAAEADYWRNNPTEET